MDEIAKYSETIVISIFRKKKINMKKKAILLELINYNLRKKCKHFLTFFRYLGINTLHK